MSGVGCGADQFEAGIGNQRCAGIRDQGDPLTAMTQRQREVLQLFAEGMSAKEIARTLGLSARTVEDHKYRMMEALGIENSAELIHFAIKHGMLQ